MATNTRPPLVWKLGLGLLVFAGSLVAGTVAASPASAVDCATAAAICANNGGTSTTSGVVPGPTSAGAPCAQGLPANPTTDCGYATIQRNYSAGAGQVTVSGLPGKWGTWTNQYLAQCQYSSYQAFNPYTGGYDTYYAKGINWIDYHSWHPQVTTASSKMSVYVAPGVVTKEPDTIIPSYYTYKTVKGKKVATWHPQVRVPGKTTVGPVTPVTVTTGTYTDHSTGTSTVTSEKTFSTAGTFSYTRTDVTLNVIWDGRIVVYNCVFPAAPDLQTVIDCPTSVGPGFMTGPTGNAVSTPWPVPTGPGTFDPQTEKKKWQTAPTDAATNPNWVSGSQGGTLYSSMGMAWRSSVTRAIFSQKGNTTALALVKGCADLTYKTSAKDQPCQYMGSTFPAKTGMWLPASDPLCNFTPGNYAKAATGLSTQCKWVQYFWDPQTQSPSGKQLFLSCTFPTECDNCAVTSDAYWLCGDVNGANGYNNTYNFFCKTNDTYMCSFASPTPTITSPDGLATKNGSQILANGKRWKISWGAPSGLIKMYVNGSYAGTVPAENTWLQWVKASNSQPSKTGISTAGSTQPVYAHWSASATPSTDTSVLTDSGSTSGKPTWAANDLYLRAYQGAGVNTTGSTLYVGRSEGVPNFATAQQNSLVPFGVYAAYVYTHPKTTSTGQGGPVTINVPETCATQMATFYITSGRPTS